MILNGRFAPRISAASTCLIALFAVMLWPSFMQTLQTEARADSIDGPAAATGKPDASTTSAFPHVVKFEQGATRFLDGDKITILEVRGTAETFMQGNIYWIKGTYTLASQDKAKLAAFTTAKEAVNGTGPSLKVQTAVINRGEGTFTLFLPMSCDGWPHVSFYPDKGGESFGGNYFGMGETVLKHWWESDEDSVIREIETLGGKLEREELPNGPVVRVDFNGSRVLKDDDINRLKSFKSLATVGLGHTRITDACLEHLAELEKTRALTKLNLRSSPTSDVDSKSIKELTTLYIDNTLITDSGVQALKSMHKLTTLGLGHTRTSNIGLKAVGQLTGLTHLYIDNTQITDAGLEELRNLKSLQTLGLGHTQITDIGLKHLRELKRLTTLYVDHTQVTDTGAQELKKSLPNVNIIR